MLLITITQNRRALEMSLMQFTTDNEEDADTRNNEDTLTNNNSKQCYSQQFVHWDTFKQDNYSSVRGWGM